MRFLFYLILIIFSFWFTFGNSTNIESILSTIQNDINSDSNPKYALVERFWIADDKQKSYPQNHILYSYMWYIKTNLRNQIETQKLSHKPNIHSLSENFFYKYNDYIVQKEKFGEKINKRCLTKKELIDDISRSMDFPTLLTIATRQIESSCNIWTHTAWPFQIMHKKYKTDDFSDIFFFYQVRDFILFSKNKRKNFNIANDKKWLSINMWYDYWNLEDIVRHGALYNWLSGWSIYWDILPSNVNYVFGNWNQENQYKKDWILVNFVKSIE